MIRKPTLEATGSIVADVTRPTRDMRMHDVALCAALAVVWLAVTLTPRAASAVAAAWSALVFAAVLLALRLVHSHRLRVPREQAVLLALAAALPLVLLASGSLADNARVSILGMIGQRTGAALWVGAWAWFAVGLLGSSSRRLIWLVRVLAVAGAFAALAALADAAGLLDAAGRYSLEPSGVLENSLSLAQTLLITGGASLSWLTFERTAALRAVAGLALALQAVAFAFAASRSALVGLVTGVVVVIALRLTRRKPAACRDAGWVLASLAAAAVATVVVLVAFAGPRTDFGERMDDLSNNRWTIWASALAQSSRAPLLGKGPEQFSCWVSWTVDSAGGIDTNATYDPHGIVFYLLLAGGALGLAAAGVGSAAVARSVWRASRTGVWPVVALAGGLAAWAASLAFTWISPIALACAAVLAGVLAGAGPSGSPPRDLGSFEEQRSPALSPNVRHPSPLTTATTAIALVACTALAIAQAPGALTELRRWSATEPGSPKQLSALEAGLQTADPAYAYQMLRSRLALAAAASDDASAALDEAQDLAQESRNDRRWHVDLALAGAELAQARSVYLGEDTWGAFSGAIEAGKVADPASGLWDYATWLEARRLGLDAEARAAATRAADFALPPRVQESLSSDAR